MIAEAEVAVRASLRSADGEEVPMDPARWFDDPRPEENELLAQAVGPVLDAGCGPGRHVVALSRRGVVAVGVDVDPWAVRLVRRRGGLALQASIFDPLPWTGRWGSVLLLDGNVGIGGDPVRLLGRVGSLLRPTGRVLLELEPPGVASRRVQVRVEVGRRPTGPWFPWALLGVDGVGRAARAAGLQVESVWTGGGRWFSRLHVR